MSRQRNKVLNSRPHPCPVPQERENFSPRLGEAEPAFNLMLFCYESQTSGDVQWGIQESATYRRLFPLPGGEGQGEGGCQTILQFTPHSDLKCSISARLLPSTNRNSPRIAACADQRNMSSKASSWQKATRSCNASCKTNASASSQLCSRRIASRNSRRCSKLGRKTSKSSSPSGAF